MRRSNLLPLPSQLVLSGLLLLFAQCQTVPEDAVLPVPTLMRGVFNGDPVVQSTPDMILPIAVKNQYDNLLATEHAKLKRPSSDSKEYEQFTKLKLIEPISADGLPKHLFQWNTTQRKNVMVCIFKNIVRVNAKTNQIANKDDLVWLWTPPVGTIDPGSISYADGKSVTLGSDNQFVLSPPGKLDNSIYHVWCILAWDDQGIRILNASRELPFVVK